MRTPKNPRIDILIQPLLDSIISFGPAETTADGIAAGTTIVCDDLATEPSYAGHQVALLTGGAWGQAMRIDTHVGNTLTVAYAFTDPAGAPAPVLHGTVFVVLKESWGLDIAAIIAILNALGLDIAAIIAILNAFSILQEAGGTLAATGPGTEDNVMLVNAPAGVFKPLKVQIDLGLMVAGDNTIIRLYYRIALAGNLLLKDQITYNGAQVPRLINVELEPNRFGFRVSLEQTAAGAGGMKNYAYNYFWES